MYWNSLLSAGFLRVDSAAMSMKALNEAKWILIIELLIAIALATFTLCGAALGLVLILFTLYFFRDPRPKLQHDSNAIVSPASGKVDVIENVVEPVFRKGDSKRVSIFLSVFDVHVQRAPVGGVVRLIQHSPGKFANAIDPTSAKENEQQTIGIEGDGIRVTVRQIAGLIARRICTWCKEGKHLPKGAHLGMIRFGSRVDIYLPTDMEIVVKLGDHVRGGETILARRH